MKMIDSKNEISIKIMGTFFKFTNLTVRVHSFGPTNSY